MLGTISGIKAHSDYSNPEMRGCKGGSSAFAGPVPPRGYTLQSTGPADLVHDVYALPVLVAPVHLVAFFYFSIVCRPRRGASQFSSCISWPNHSTTSSPFLLG